MQKAIGLIVLGSGLGLSVYMNAPSSSEREAQVAAITRIVARATILEPETVAAEQPGLRRPVSSPAFGAAMPAAAIIARQLVVLRNPPTIRTTPLTQCHLATMTRSLSRRHLTHNALERRRKAPTGDAVRIYT